MAFCCLLGRKYCWLAEDLSSVVVPVDLLILFKLFNSKVVFDSSLSNFSKLDSRSFGGLHCEMRGLGFKMS